MKQCPQCGTFHTTEESKACLLYEEEIEITGNPWNFPHEDSEEETMYLYFET